MKTNQTKNRIATPFGDLQVDVENLFEQFFGDGQAPVSGSWLPATNILETDTGYQLAMELPGVKPDDVSVEIHDGILEVSGVKQVACAVDGAKQLRGERRGGDFNRKFEFTTLVDADRIGARFENGLLLIDLPKSEKALPRKIQIQVAE